MGEGRKAASSQGSDGAWELSRAALCGGGAGTEEEGRQFTHPHPKMPSGPLAWGPHFTGILSAHLGSQSSHLRSPEQASDPACGHLLSPSPLSWGESDRPNEQMANRDSRNAGTHLGSHSCVYLPSLGIASWWWRGQGAIRSPSLLGTWAHKSSGVGSWRRQQA